LTPEVANISGIPHVMDLDENEVGKILNA